MSNDSVLQTVEFSPKWYFETPELVYEYMFLKNKDLLGRSSRYIQNLVMYELQWRLSTKVSSDWQLRDKYIEMIQRLLKHIDSMYALKKVFLFTPDLNEYRKK